MVLGTGDLTASFLEGQISRLPRAARLVVNERPAALAPSALSTCSSRAVVEGPPSSLTSPWARLWAGLSFGVRASPTFQAPWRRTLASVPVTAHRQPHHGARLDFSRFFWNFFLIFLPRERSMERRSRVEFWAYRIGMLIHMASRRSGVARTHSKGQRLGRTTKGVLDLTAGRPARPCMNDRTLSNLPEKNHYPVS